MTVGGEDCASAIVATAKNIAARPARDILFMTITLLALRAPGNLPAHREQAKVARTQSCACAKLRTVKRETQARDVVVTGNA
jgi:hypothetical protein